MPKAYESFECASTGPVCLQALHLLLVKDPSWGGLYLNPGAAGKQGFHAMRTLLRFNLADGQVLNPEVVELTALKWPEVLEKEKVVKLVEHR